VFSSFFRFFVVFDFFFSIKREIYEMSEILAFIVGI